MVSSRIGMFVCLVLAAVSVRGQVYWSSTEPDCGNLWEVSYPNPTGGGGTVYSCAVGGTFLWLAAGGAWGTSLRVSAPATNAVGVEYWFYDTNGQELSLDSTVGTGSSVSSGSTVTFALNANQPSQINLLGTTGTNYGNTQTGSAYAEFYCPDEVTCANILPQLIYSALPTVPWSLSVPISWDVTEMYPIGWATAWSAVGVDNGGLRRVSIAVYNQNAVDSSSSPTPSTYAVRVYDQNGNLAGAGTTPPLAPILLDSDGYAITDGGTWGALLSCSSGCPLTTPLPSGPFKVVVDGGSSYCSVEVLQVNGTSATTLQVGFEGSGAANIGTAGTTGANALQKTHSRVTGRPRQPHGAFAPLPR